MSDLTPAQIVTIRAKTADKNDPPAISDARLNEIWQESAFNLNLTVASALEELLADASKFADYTQGETEEKRSQVFKHLAMLADRYRGLYEQELAKTKQSFRFVQITTRKRNAEMPGGNDPWEFNHG